MEEIGDAANGVFLAMAGADIPLNRLQALHLVDDLFAAIEVLADHVSVSATSAQALIDCADELLDLVDGIGGGVWLSRTAAIALASTILDHGYIPLYELTMHQTLALDLLTHHDRLMALSSDWP